MRAVARSGPAGEKAAFPPESPAYGISTADITALDVIGWGAQKAGGFSLSLAQIGSVSKAVEAAAVPEPSTLAMVAVGTLGFWLLRRRRSA